MAVTAENFLNEGQPGMTPRQCLEFFVLAPAVVGLFFGMARLGSQDFQAVWQHVLYLTVHTTLAWICWGIGAKVTSLVLRPWQPSLLFVLVVGHFLGGFGFWWPLRELLNQPFGQFLVAGSHFPRFWPPERWDSYLIYTLQGCSLWVIANWVDFRVRRVGRFGFAPPPRADVVAGTPSAVEGSSAAVVMEPFASAGGPLSGVAAPVTVAGIVVPAAPRLRQRLPPNLKDADILVLEAEEHYIKVHTTKGNTLLLMRLTDAMNEMEPLPGLRVHRSFWVSKEAVVRVFRRERRWFMQVSNGIEIPVSRSYRVIVQNAGLKGGTGLADD